MKEKIRTLEEQFCDLMFKDQPDIQFVKVRIGLKDKSEVKFKKYRGT